MTDAATPCPGCDGHECPPCQYPGAARPVAETERDAVHHWMIGNGYATGHGDTLSCLLLELEAQAKERGARNAPTGPSPSPSREALEAARATFERIEKFDCFYTGREYVTETSVVVEDDGVHNVLVRGHCGRVAGKAIASIDAALAAQPAQAGETWQTTDSAPRDGSNILLCDARVQDHQIVCYWDDQPKTIPFHWATPDGCHYHAMAFTHWMPLPKAPEMAKGRS